MMGFNPLKVVFPGHVKRVQQEPVVQPSSPSAVVDAVDDAAHAAADAAAPSTSASSPVQPPHAASDTAAAAPAEPATARSSLPIYEQSRIDRFTRLLQPQMVDLNALQEAAWTGVPHQHRPRCWRLLLRYEPPSCSRAASVLQRKRREYQGLAHAHYERDVQMWGDDNAAELKQVSVDVPRTAPEVPCFQQPALQAALRRLLYIWGVRHPASGYVQGVNDLATPFLAIFLSEHLAGPMAEWDVGTLPAAQMLAAEADSYWCLCKLVERVQDVYTHGQPGVQSCLEALEELIGRVDAALARHFGQQGINYYQFAFRWVNCMLIREVPFAVSLRLWDTYLAEGMLFREFLPYACAAFLLTWSAKLKAMDFQEAILFLQRLPTGQWTHRELEAVLSHAHMLRASFDNAHGHLAT